MSRLFPLIALAGAAAVTAAALAPTASAAMLDVEFAGMDLYYGFDGKTNLQSGPVAGNEDALDAATFYVDGVNIGTLTGGMNANLGIPGFRDIPLAGGTRSNLYENGYFRVNFDTSDLHSGLLNLGVDAASKVDLTYVGDRMQLTFTGSNTGLYTQQPIARLPAWPGFNPGDTIRFSFSSSSLSDVLGDGTKLTRFHARGSGTIAQDAAAVPEPAGLAVLAVGGLASLRRRRVK